MSDTRYHGRPCRVCGSTERYRKHDTCCACSARRVKDARIARGPQRRSGKAKAKTSAILPVGQSDFIKPPTRAQLMAGR